MKLTPEWTGPSGAAIRSAIMDGDPRIGIRFDPDHNELEINAFNMQSGEPEIVGARLREELLRR